MADKDLEYTVFFHSMDGLNEWQRKYYSKIIITEHMETADKGYLITFFLNRKHLSVKPSYTDQIMNIVEIHMETLYGQDWSLYILKKNKM